MTPLQASTTLLTHCDSFATTGSRRVTGEQSSSTFLVTVTSALSRFGGASIDVYNEFYAGLRFPSAAAGIKPGLPVTIDGWVYIRNFRSRSGTIFGATPPGGSRLTAFAAAHTSDGRPACVLRDGANNANLIIGPDPLPTMQWVHIAISYDGGTTRRLFVNGTQVASGSAIASGGVVNLSDLDVIMGSAGDSATLPVDGCVDELRCVNAHDLYGTSNFTPPTAPYDDIPRVAEPDRPRLFSVRAGSPLIVTPSATQAARLIADVQDGGRGAIVSTVKERNTPVDTPLRRKVWLVNDRSGRVVRETWSDALTGAYSFANIDETQRYSVVSFDHLRNYRAVIADNLTPTVP